MPRRSSSPCARSTTSRSSCAARRTGPRPTAPKRRRWARSWTSSRAALPATGDLARPGFAAPASVGDVFQGAASAIAKSAREVAERGRPDPEGPEFRSFAALLVKVLESEPDVVPVTSLYYEDAGPHV